MIYYIEGLSKMHLGAPDIAPDIDDRTQKPCCKILFELNMLHVPLSLHLWGMFTSV